MICCLHHSRLVIAILALVGVIMGLGFYFQWSFVTQNWPFFIALLCPLGHLLGGRHIDHEDKKVKSKKGC